MIDTDQKRLRTDVREPSNHTRVMLNCMYTSHTTVTNTAHATGRPPSAQPKDNLFVRVCDKNHAIFVFHPARVVVPEPSEPFCAASAGNPAANAGRGVAHWRCGATDAIYSVNRARTVAATHQKHRTIYITRRVGRRRRINSSSSSTRDAVWCKRWAAEA